MADNTFEVHLAANLVFQIELFLRQLLLLFESVGIHHTGKSVFRGLNNDFLATRYHSLTIAPQSMPAVLDVTATSEDGVIQGVMHKSHPVHGVQFHPESIASEHGHLMLRNFLELAAQWNAARGCKVH